MICCFIICSVLVLFLFKMWMGAFGWCCPSSSCILVWWICGYIFTQWHYVIWSKTNLCDLKPILHCMKGCRSVHFKMSYCIKQTHFFSHHISVEYQAICSQLIPVCPPEGMASLFKVSEYVSVYCLSRKVWCLRVVPAFFPLKSYFQVFFCLPPLS